MPIPDFKHGLLPPFVGDGASELGRSPYSVSLVDVVDRFGRTPERQRLLTGLLDYRAKLHKAGLDSGFQWVDGSFVEDKEWLKGEAPNDIDVVTFYYVPDGYTQQTLRDAFPALFSRSARAEMRRLHSVDAFLRSLSQTVNEGVLSHWMYWHSLWSHKKHTKEWKGYLRIDLSGDEDEEARRKLADRAAEGGS